MSQAVRHEAPAAASDDVALVLARVRAWAALRTAWLRGLWAAEGTPAGAHLVTHQEADSALAGSDDPRHEAHWRASAQAADLVTAARTADARVAAATGRVTTLCRVLALEDTDADLLHLALAVAVDVSSGRLCAYLHDAADRAFATEQLVARIFGHERPAPWLADSPLFRWGVLRREPGPPGVPDAIRIDPHDVAWCLGRPAIDPVLVGRVAVVDAHPPLSSWPVAETVGFVRRVTRQDQDARVRIIVRGVPGTGRRTFAAAVAAAASLPVLAVDGDGSVWDELVARGTRQAWLDGIAPIWVGAQALAGGWHAAPSAFPLQFVTAEPRCHPQSWPGVVDHVIDLPPTRGGDRRELWRRHVPAARRWPAAALEDLATRYRATPGEIAAAGRGLPRTPADAAALVRQKTAERAGELVQVLECPFEPDDLVVPERVRAVLDDIAYEAGVRSEFWEQVEARRLFPAGRSLIALFAGPAGTGKTMAAQVIARTLGYDLWRIDLSSVVSKYVGETASNIERLLRHAAGADVVLLFDEADALYGKRPSEVRDAQDRYVNMDTGHLMVAIESFDGIALLTTNQKTAIDPAFVRRLRHVVDFPVPDAAARRAIWERVLAGLAGTDAVAELAPTLDALCDGVEATGSQIKYAALGAVLAARRAATRVSPAHLVAGLNRELGKDGRPLSDRDLARLERP